MFAEVVLAQCTFEFTGKAIIMGKAQLMFGGNLNSRVFVAPHTSLVLLNEID